VRAQLVVRNLHNTERSFSLVRRRSDNDPPALVLATPRQVLLYDTRFYLHFGLIASAEMRFCELRMALIDFARESSQLVLQSARLLFARLDQFPTIVTQIAPSGGSFHYLVRRTILSAAVLD
jgi:hypothetical protein